MKTAFYQDWFVGKTREHPELNQGPLDLQSNALPLSYIPLENPGVVDIIKPICRPSAYWKSGDSFAPWCSHIYHYKPECVNHFEPHRENIVGLNELI